MGTNCAPVVADLFLFCYESDFTNSLSRENQADLSKSNTDNVHFGQIVDRLNPADLLLDQSNSSDIEVPFFFI